MSVILSVTQSIYRNPFGKCFAEVLTPQIRPYLCTATKFLIYERTGAKQHVLIFIPQQ